MKRRNDFRGKKSGFTLIEILLVLALLSMLVGFAVFKGGSIFTDSQADIVSMKVKEAFKVPLFKYRTDTGNFPTSEQGLKALLQKPSNDRGRWRGPYIEGPDNLIDEWGNEFRYRFPGTKNTSGYDLYSLGADGKESEDDIGNW